MVNVNIHFLQLVSRCMGLRGHACVNPNNMESSKERDQKLAAARKKVGFMLQMNEILLISQPDQQLMINLF